MASVNFSPTGSQLDSDSLADIALNTGDLAQGEALRDRFTANFALDTSDLDTNLQSLTLRLFQDLTEVNLSDTPTDFFVTTFPDVTIGETNFDGDFLSIVVELTGDVGAIPDEVNVIIESEVTALDGLVNDGTADIAVTVLEAIDVNGQDVTELFAPLTQAIDLQPLSIPTISIGIEPSFAVEGREEYTVNFFLDQPAPPGGLPVRVQIIDDDEEGDSIANFAESINLENPQVKIEDGKAIVNFTFTEGTTKASLDFTPVEDNKEEGNERFALTLLSGDSYNVNVDRSTINSLIADADLVIDGTVGDDLLKGTNETDTILGKRGNDFISGNGGADALFGENGDDLLSSGIGNDFVNGGKGRDRLFGGTEDDLLLGENGQDRLLGEDGFDTLNGGDGKDTLIGGNDSDLLVGGRGSDRLIGVDISSNKPGIGEQDTLTGGSGRDTFVLGNEAGIFYDDGDNIRFGEADFALITDLNSTKDRIQLFGFANQYNLDFVPNDIGTVDARLIYDSGLNSSTELIAVLENTSTDLNINDAVFTFV